MADPIDLLARDYRETAGALDVADHNRNWAQTFSSTPPTEVLRANQNYDELLSRAIEQKQQLGSLTNKKQQELYYNSRLQPLKEQLLQGQIEHQTASTLAAGALTRFQMQKDRDTMSDTVGFLDWMEKAPDRPGTPAYQTHSLEGLKKFPRIITNAAGKEVLKHIAEENDGIAALNDATVTRYARVQGEIEGFKTGAKVEEKSNTSKKLPDVPYSKSAEWSAAAKEAAILEGAHPELKNVAKPEPAATPKRMKFNPQTGKLE